jgi:hypothetical protein
VALRTADPAQPARCRCRPESRSRPRLPVFRGLLGQGAQLRHAGCDIDALQAAHPDFCFLGHVDKLTMNRGEAAMRGEFERLLPAMRRGRFIPSVDHQTPPEVSLEQYGIYARLFREYAERACR